MDKSLIGSNIKRLRDLKGLSQEGLGAASGVSRGAIQQIEAGENFTFDTLVAIAGALGVGLDQLIPLAQEAPPGESPLLTVARASEILPRILNMPPIYQAAVLYLIFRDRRIFDRLPEAARKLLQDQEQIFQAAK